MVIYAKHDNWVDRTRLKLEGWFGSTKPATASPPSQAARATSNVPVAARPLPRPVSKRRTHPAVNQPPAAPFSLPKGDCVQSAILACNDIRAYATASDVNKQLIVSAGGIAWLIDTAQKHARIEPVIQAACATLRAVCSRDADRPAAFAACSGFIMLRDAAIAHIDDEATMQEVTYTCYTMLSHPTNRDAFQAADMAAVLSDVAAKHAGSSHIVWNVSKALERGQSTEADAHARAQQGDHQVYDVSVIASISIDAAFTTQPTAASQQQQQQAPLGSTNMQYYGPMKDGKPHGHGKGVSANATYTGQWIEGLPHGTGTAVGTCGCRYEGEWLAGKKHGHGVIEPGGDGCHHRGMRYSGSWKLNERHGRGAMLWEQGPRKGDRYDGEWLDNHRHGRGTYVWANGNKYSGVWKYGLKHGDGLLVDAKFNVIWKGLWVDDEPAMR